MIKRLNIPKQQQITLIHPPLQQVMSINIVHAKRQLSKPSHIIYDGNADAVEAVGFHG